MPEEGVPVDRNLCVQSHHLAILGHDQRVDLDQGGVLGARHLRQPGQHLRGLVADVLVEPGLVDDRPRGGGVEFAGRVDVALDEGARVRLGHRLDVHAALRRDHREQLLLAPVEDDRGVVLGGDRRACLDPDLVDPEGALTARAADVHADDRLGMLARLLRVPGDLDPARLAPAADQDLGLDGDGKPDPLRGGDSLVGRGGDLAAGHGHSVLREELLSLVFE